ncbi:methyltransferase domain-containing protein [Selenomonas sputigena]|uniref:methyltransferase domain-containing protein n=1 Tax=Selenomonas sputigena TaxID=69823 RepID=UPI002231DD70|nr:methyltransferase domain-containing protein [Selenomonas sputigena]UZD42269.1 methyltransferase domain-containing protein [Selenomonas sputigena]
MLTIVLLLTGDVQEARMMQAYLQENYPGEEYERILVYCGEDAEALAFLDQEVSAVLFDGRGAGIAASCNAALHHANGQEILFSAACYILVPSALLAMQRAAGGSDGASLVVPMMKDALGVDEVQRLPADPGASYWDADGLHRFAERLSANRDTFFVSAVLDFCFLAQRQALLDIGGFSEEFHTTPFLMLDLCLRFWQMGRPRIAACGAFAHRNEMAFPYSEQDEATFIRKYGLKYPYSFLPRTDLLEMVDLQKPSLAVLEVGCACGATLLAIRNKNPEARLYGIEFNAQAAALASHFAVVESLDVETLDRPAWHEKFDYIILGDVIEHLREPQRAMKNLALLLKPGGCVLVSTPNVMHFSVFRMMLAGRWKYEEAGILDRTHLRFFTRTELLALLREAGLEPQVVFESREETEHDQAFIAQLAALMPPGVDAQELHAFQWKVVAQKR